MANDLEWLTSAYTLEPTTLPQAQAVLICKSGSVAVSAVIGSDTVAISDYAASAGDIIKIDRTAMPELLFTPTAAEFIVLS